MIDEETKKNANDQLKIDLKNLINNFNDKPIDSILVDVIQRFFQNYTFSYSNNENIDLISKIMNKCKNLELFNIFICYYNLILKCLNENRINYKNTNDIIIKPIFLFKDKEYKISNNLNELKNGKIINFSINFTCEKEENFNNLIQKLEEIINIKDEFYNYDLIKNPFPKGYIIQCKLNNSFLVTKKINNNLLNIKNNTSIIEDEKNIKLNFQSSQRNTKIFKETYNNFINYIKSNKEIMNYIDNIYPFGSIIQFTQNKSSDLEITLITKNYQTINQEERNNIISLIETHIKNNENYIDINIIPTNRTTLIKCQDKKTNIKIEANMNNFFGIYNGNLIRNYLLIDSRALILVNTIKDWSKRKKINSNYDRYLSSYCFTLMTIYFLQRLDPPILPVISSKNDLIKTTIENKEYYLEKKLISKDIIKYKSENNDSIATLFIKWLIFYLYLFKEEYYCIDITRKKQLFRSNYMRYMNHYKENNVSRNSVYIFIDMFDYKYNPGSYFKNETSQHDYYKSKLLNTLNQLLNGDEKFIFEEDN